jgi:hypothetical protein
MLSLILVMLMRGLGWDDESLVFGDLRHQPRKVEAATLDNLFFGGTHRASSLNLKGENPGPTFIGYLGLSPRWKPKICWSCDDGACMLFTSWKCDWITSFVVHVPSMVGICVLLRVVVHRGGALFFSSFSIWMCASLLSFKCFIGVEGRCSWYLCDINIFSL